MENFNDKGIKKAAFTNLGTLGNIASSWDHCGVDVCAKESNTSIVAATSLPDISFSNKVSRHIKI